MESIVIVAERTDAIALREMLRRRWLDGVKAQERRVWLFWRRFEITGPAPALASLRAEFERYLDDFDMRKA